MKKVKDEKKYNNKFRKKYIPKQYNQIKLIDYLENDNLDHYISISNRADGKTVNYINYFIDYSIRTGIGFFLLARHYTVRFAYQDLLWKIIDTINQKYNPKDFYMHRTDFYITIGYQDKTIGVISDLNSAQDLKYHSNFLADFPIMIYDEFLALESDYLPDEWERLYTIYGSVNRDFDIPKIKTPKLFYLGNAVNFSSPILANLELYETLESMDIGSVKIKDNVVIEVNKNENVNQERNLRAFDESKKAMTHGEFEINSYNIADKYLVNRVYANKKVIIIKLGYNYMRIEYLEDTHDVILSITSYEEYYDYNFEIKDTKEDTTFLSEKYKSDNHFKKYNKDIFKFRNQYSKDFILSDDRLLSIKINKLIYEMMDEPEMDKEELYRDNYIQRSKENLARKFFEC